MSSTELSAADKQHITDTLLAGRKVEAIKHYREVTGEGLREAKDFIDAMAAELSKSHPEIVQVNRGGCGSAALVLICLSVTVLWLLK